MQCLPLDLNLYGRTLRVATLSSIYQWCGEEVLGGVLRMRCCDVLRWGGGAERCRTEEEYCEVLHWGGGAEVSHWRGGAGKCSSTEEEGLRGVPLRRRCWEVSHWWRGAGRYRSEEEVLGGVALRRRCWEVSHWGGGAGRCRTEEEVMGGVALRRRGWEVSHSNPRLSTREGKREA